MQAGLLEARSTALPMATVIMKELEVLGTKGMSARQYPELMDLILDSGMDLGLLVQRTMTRKLHDWHSAHSVYAALTCNDR